MTGFARFIPLLVIVVLVTLFALMLGGDRNPKEIKSVLIGKPVPEFSLPALNGGALITQQSLKTGKPLMVNFFASWCVPCRAEHESLMYLATELHLPIVGIAYNDRPEKSKLFLENLGNPFSQVAADEEGRVLIEWGASGVPESFLIDGNGIIRYRHWGPIVGDSLEKRLLPVLKELRQEAGQ